MKLPYGRYLSLPLVIRFADEMQLQELSASWRGEHGRWRSDELIRGAVHRELERRDARYERKRRRKQRRIGRRD